MKKFWIVLLAAALAVVTALPASAQKTSVSVSGEFIVHGMYIDNFGLGNAGPDGIVGNADDGEAPSVAFTAQRLRLTPVFSIAPGLTFTVRADLMERIWGADRLMWPQAGAVPPIAPAGGVGAINRGSSTAFATEDENIGIDRAFMTLDTKAGRLMVGFQAVGAWGTVFGNAGTSRPRIAFTRAMGPWTVGAIYENVRDNVAPTVDGAGGIDGMDMELAANRHRQNDVYFLHATYTQKTWTAGVLLAHQRQGILVGAHPHNRRLMNVHPFFTGRFGALRVEAELGMGFGKWRDSTIPGVSDIDEEGLRYFVDLRYTMGPLTIGAIYAFAQGDDPATLNKNEGTLPAGPDFNPMMMLGNDRRHMGMGWAGGAMFGPGLEVGGELANMRLWQLNMAYRVTKELGLDARFTSVRLDEQNAGGINRFSATVGHEFSIQATYNIRANLNYQVGFAHFWTGDAFKGANAANVVHDNYLIQHRLNLTF